MKKMQKNKNRMFLLVLVLAVCLIVEPMQVMAGVTADVPVAEQEEAETEAVVTPDEANISLISDYLEVSQEDRASKKVMELTDVYGELSEVDSKVLDVKMDGTTAQVIFQTECDAWLYVGIYSDDGKQLLYHSITEVTERETEASVELSTALPEYYRIKSFLLQKEDTLPLCEAYETDFYTQAFQEQYRKTTADFPEDRVLNFDTDETMNFVVFNENVVVKRTSSQDEETYISELNNVDVCIDARTDNSDIEKGTLLVWIKDGKMERYGMVTDIKTIDKGAQGQYQNYYLDQLNISLEQMYSYMKIEKNDTMDSIELNLNERTSSLQGTLSYTIHYTMHTYLWENLKEVAQIERAEYQLAGSSMNHSGTSNTMNETQDVTVFPNITLSDRQEFTITTTQEGDISAKWSCISGAIYRNGQGIYQYELLPQVDTQEVGSENVKINTTNISTLRYFNQEVCLLEKYYYTTITWEKKSTFETESLFERLEQHTCKQCMEQTARANIAKFANMTWNGKKESTGNTGTKQSLLLGRYYYLPETAEAGIGYCPNHKYLIQVNVVDKNELPIKNTLVSFEDGTRFTTDASGNAEVYMTAGNHTAYVGTAKTETDVWIVPYPQRLRIAVTDHTMKIPVNELKECTSASLQKLSDTEYKVRTSGLAADTTYMLLITDGKKTTEYMKESDIGYLTSVKSDAYGTVVSSFANYISQPCVYLYSGEKYRNGFLNTEITGAQWAGNISYLNIKTFSEDMKELKEYRDYIVCGDIKGYSPGTYRIYLLGVGNNRYWGFSDLFVQQKEKTYYNIGESSIELPDLTANGKTQNCPLKIRYNNKLLVKNVDYTVSGSTSAKNPGKYKITIKGIGDYTGSIKKSYNVSLAKTSIKKAENVKKGIKIIWKKVPIANGYEIYRKSGNAKYKKIKVITKGATVSWTDLSVKLGEQYSYEIRPYYGKIKGKFSNKKILHRINNTKVRSVKKTASKTIIVKWKKTMKVTGYQIRYSQYKSMKKSSIKVVSGYKNISKKITGLRGKKYYVQVCTYKTSKGMTSTSMWSNIKTVKMR